MSFLDHIQRQGQDSIRDLCPILGVIQSKHPEILIRILLADGEQSLAKFNIRNAHFKNTINSHSEMFAGIPIFCPYGIVFNDKSHGRPVY